MNNSKELKVFNVGRRYYKFNNKSAMAGIFAQLCHF